MSVEIRASDDDRQRVIDALQRHTAAGRLSLDEFTDRVGDAYSARTLGDLEAITRDLPATADPGAEDDAVPAHRPVRRDLLIIFAVAAATLIVLGLLMLLRPERVIP
jgi:hypothetical protein